MKESLPNLTNNEHQTCLVFLLNPWSLVMIPLVLKYTNFFYSKNGNFIILTIDVTQMINRTYKNITKV